MMSNKNYELLEERMKQYIDKLFHYLKADIKMDTQSEEEIQQELYIGMIHAWERFNPFLSFWYYFSHRLSYLLKDKMREKNVIGWSSKGGKTKPVILSLSNGYQPFVAEKNKMDLLVFEDFINNCKCSEKSKKLLKLRYIEGYTFKEIGERLNLNACWLTTVHKKILESVKQDILKTR